MAIKIYQDKAQVQDSFLDVVAGQNELQGIAEISNAISEPIRNLYKEIAERQKILQGLSEKMESIQAMQAIISECAETISLSMPHIDININVMCRTSK